MRSFFLGDEPCLKSVRQLEGIGGKNHVRKCKKIENYAEKVLKERCYLVYNYLYTIWFLCLSKTKTDTESRFPIAEIETKEIHLKEMV